MSAPVYDELQVGDELPVLELAAITRLTLALYCAGSNDHNPIHVDSDVARATGYGDVIGHGMLSMAYVGRLLTSWVSADRIRSLDCRFVDYTRPGDEPVLTGTVTEKFETGDENRVRLSLQMATLDGSVKAKGEAVVAL